MNLIKSICILLTFCCALHAQATIIVVNNVNDTGAGSLRDAVASASSSANDTILIDVKGTISLDSAIVFDSFTALTVIGPYAKHNAITSSAGWIGSLFKITNSGGIIFQNLGFDGGNGFTRHVRLVDCADEIIFERCVFKNSNLTIAAARGASVKVIASSAVFNQCSFIDNQADYGGAISARLAASLSVNNCTFSGNVANVSAGALDAIGSSTVSLLFNTFVNNTAAIAPEAIQCNVTTSVTLGNNAIGDNGTDNQMLLAGLVGSSGRNVIKKNSFGEPDYLPGAFAGDSESTLNILGLRASILEDGYGLIYWPITDATSNLINPASPGGSVPDFDCRNAPRALKGISLINAYPDAGACEYTHLRVTNDDGGLLPGSFLNALSILPRDVMHYIEFDITSPGDIMLTAEGIVDNAPYIIDGFSQSGSAIPGPSLTVTPGLTGPILPIDFVNGGSLHHCIKFDDFVEGSILQGVSVQGFDRHGVEPNRSDNISIFGCEIGIDNDGAENGTARAGIRINSENNIIGGWEHWMRNTISGNGLGGVEQSNIYISTGNDGNIIMGNIIGGSPDGMSGIGLVTPTLGGIYIDSRFNIIGGTLPNSGNIIIANQFGTYHYRDGGSNRYSGNSIGLAWDGLTAVGNSIVGISFGGADDNIVGGLSPAYQNRIAYNGIGVEVKFESSIAQGNAILGNAIYNNDNQGIDINGDNLILPNDGLMNVSHSNRGIDFPEITESTACAGPSTITTFDLSVPIGATYRIEFFTVTSPDPTNGEGENFIGFTNVTVATNPETFVFEHGFDVGAGLNITATVTQLSTGNTSEFGNHVVIASSPGDPTISYDDICPWETASPNFDGDTGGDFRFSDPVPTDGAAIDPITGEVTGALEGITYEVIYGFSGPCAIEDTADFSVNSIDETFVFPDFCPGSDGMPSSVVTPGGTFSLNPDLGDGAVLTADDGILSGGVEGTTYTIQYIADDGTCIDTGFVDVLVTPINETFTMDDFCPEVLSAPASPATPGGTFYFTPDPADGATIDISTGAVTGGIEGSTYTITYEVGTCAETFSLDVYVLAIDESFTFADFCPETVGMPADVVETGGFSFLTDPGDGAIINPGTGFITGGTEGTTYDVLHMVGVCNDTDVVSATMLAVLEDFTYDDFCIIGDSSSTLPLAVDPANASYSLVDPPGIETIDPVTGTIHDPVEGTIYTVVNTNTTDFGIIECTQTDTIMVTAILIPEAFSYDNYCFGTSGIPYDFIAGGTFSLVGGPYVGVTIDPATGIMTGGEADDSFTIRYVYEIGDCADSSEVIISIIQPDASFTFEPICPGLLVSLDPEELFEGGYYEFEFDPMDGATIEDSLTGAISNPQEDSSYHVVYTLLDADDPSCFNKDTMIVHVTNVPEAIDHENFCWYEDSEVALVEILGTLSFGTPAPLDAATLTDDGIIGDASEDSTYTIVHTLTVDVCSQSDSILITAIGVAEAFVFDDYCPADLSPAPTTLAYDSEWSFFPDPEDGAIINSETGQISFGIEDSMYIVMHTAFSEFGGCSESAIDTVYVIGVNESFEMENFCAAYPSEFGDPTIFGGTYTFNPDPGDDALIDEDSGEITFASHGETYGVMYTLTIGSCTESQTNLVTAYASEVADFTIDDYCANISSPIEIIGTAGGWFEFDLSPSPDGAIIDSITGIINGSIGGIYDITYFTVGTDTTCADTITKALTLHDIPTILEVSSDKDIYCPIDELGPISITENFASSQIYWYIGDTGGVISDSTFTYTPASLNLGDNTFYAKPKSSEGCYGEYASYILYLSDTSGMQAISDFAICLGSEAQLSAYGGSNYLWHTDAPISDNINPDPIAFSLEDETYVVSIFNVDECEVKDSIRVTFLPQNECAINVNNAFSPNDDGKNDFWYIDNLINYLPNIVYIYNRWGDELRKIENYDNITLYWDGTDDNGNELPPGTYFYVVITEGADQSQASWVQLVR